MLFRLKNNTKIDLLLVFTLFLPVFWEQLASIILATVSSIISTNIDTSFLNATSLVGSVFSPYTTLYSCVATGASILISQYAGAGDGERSRSLFSTSMLLGTAISAIIAVVIILFRSPILHSSYPNMSEEFFDNACVYSIFYAVTLPLTFFRTNTIGILRGSMDTKGPLYISLIGGIVDILLKLLFMVVLDMGIVGLGLASVITNILFTVTCAVIIGKAGTFKGCLSGIIKLFRLDVAIEVVKIGIVMCIQAFLISIGGLILSQILTTQGDDHVSAYSIATSVEALIYLVPMSLAYVVQILAGRHTGAGNEKEALSVSVNVTIISTVIHIFLSVIAFIFAKPLVSMYTGEPEVIRIAAETLRVAAVVMPIGWSGGNVLPAGIRGMGNVKLPAAVLVISLFLFKIPATWLVCTRLGYGSAGRMAVYSVEFLIYTVCFAIYAIMKKRKLNK